MAYTQTFFVEGRLLGSVERSAVFYHEERVAPPSLLWVCRVCGEFYARAPVQSSSGRISEYHTITRLCRKHPARSMFEVPGSLWNSWDKDLIAALPVPVLQYEMERHIEAYIATTEGELNGSNR